MLSKIDNTIKKAIMFFGTGTLARSVYNIIAFLYRCVAIFFAAFMYFGITIFLLDPDQKLLIGLWFGFSTIGFFLCTQYFINRRNRKTLDDLDW